MSTVDSSPENFENNDINNNKAAENKFSAASPFLSDLTDGRIPGDWKTRYDDNIAQAAISYEKNYLLSLFIINISLSILLALILKQYNLCNQNSIKFIYSFLGGMIGGCVFSSKWLIHSVAKNTWNRDRRLWRIFTPIVSGVLGFVVILLLYSDVITIGKLNATNIYKCYGVAFLVGYFSDNAIGKLTEIAQVFFGSSMNRTK